MKNTAYDIVIVGAGLAGLTMALALAGIAKKFNLNIALLDQATHVPPTPQSWEDVPVEGDDSRATALALGSCHLLHSIGAWQALAPFAKNIEHIGVSDQDHTFGLQMHAHQVHQKALGYVVQNKQMAKVCWHLIHTYCAHHIQVLDQAKVMAINNAQQNTQVQYQQDPDKEPHQLTCQLVIMADGGRSDVYASLGMYSQIKPYYQVALAVNAVLDTGHQNWAYECFTPDGPLALLPLCDAENQSRAAIVWTQPKARLEALKTMTDNSIIAALQQILATQIKDGCKLIALGHRLIYPLALTQANEQVRQGLVVIGNAAHTLHPIAGQGFNLALRGIFSLADQVHHACQTNQPIGDLTVLNVFLAAHQHDQIATVAASDKLMGLFANDTTSQIAMRQIGLAALNKLPLMKSLGKTAFTRAAMGLGRPLASVLPVQYPQPVPSVTVL